MTAAIVGRPRRKRQTDRVNYKLDSDLRAILAKNASQEGRNEGAQVERLILLDEAIRRLNSEGVDIPFNEINAKINQIWSELEEEEEIAK